MLMYRCLICGDPAEEFGPYRREHLLCRRCCGVQEAEERSALLGGSEGNGPVDSTGLFSSRPGMFTRYPEAFFFAFLWATIGVAILGLLYPIALWLFG